MKRNHSTFIGMIFGALAGLGLVACGGPTSDPAKESSEIQSKEQAVGKTEAPFSWPNSPSHIVTLEFRDHGTIRLALYAQLAPKTVAHFLQAYGGNGTTRKGG